MTKNLEIVSDCNIGRKRLSRGGDLPDDITAGDVDALLRQGKLRRVDDGRSDSKKSPKA